MNFSTILIYIYNFKTQAVCHIWVKNDGLAYAVVTDSEYPSKVAFTIIREMDTTFT